MEEDWGREGMRKDGVWREDENRRERVGTVVETGRLRMKGREER